MRREILLLCAGVAGGPVLGALPVAPAAAQAPATPPARCGLQIVHARPTPGGVDAALATLKPHLEREPFEKWKSFKLLSGEEAVIQPGASAAYALPWGKTATIAYGGVARTPAGRAAVRGTLEAQGPKASHRTGFTVEEGKPFLVAGEKYQDGILIYAVSCRIK